MAWSHALEAFTGYNGGVIESRPLQDIMEK